MAVVVFGKAPTVYHYMPADSQPDAEITRCGMQEKRGQKPFALETYVPTNWQPCDRCSEIDDRDQRFVGTF